MSLTRKYYKIIAQCIKDNSGICINNSTCNILNKDSLINDLSKEFKQDNNLFNRDKFVDACK